MNGIRRGHADAAATAGGRSRPGAWAVVAVLALGLGSCSSDPDPDEVIREGRVPPGDTWCRLLPDGQVQALLGDVDPERVRQVGDVTPIGGVTQRCNIVWADGDTPVEIVALRTWSSPGGQAFVDEVTRMRDLFGPDGGRLASDEVREVLPGVYYVEADGQLAAHLACDVGAELPELLTGRLSMTPTESGRLPTTEELATVGEELAELAPWSHQCAGAVTPLGAQDWEALGDRYFELQDEG